MKNRLNYQYKGIAVKKQIDKGRLKVNKESKSRKDLGSYYENCAFPKPKSKKKKLLHNGFKDKSQRICWYTGQPGAERHEIFGGPNRQTSIEMGFQVDLCQELHARLHANADDWAKTENRKWRMYFQTIYEEELIASGETPEKARTSWMALIGRNYL